MYENTQVKYYPLGDGQFVDMVEELRKAEKFIFLEFFIVHEDSTYLDGKYACFGYVTEGIEVVDAICESISAEAYVDSIGLVQSESQPVIESIKVID